MEKPRWWEPGYLRKRDAQFVKNVIEAIDRFGALNDQAKIWAARHTYCIPRTYAGTKRFKVGLQDATALAKAEAKLILPEIKQALANYVEEATDFSPNDGVRLWVDHIKGRIKKQVVVDGEVTEVDMPPSYSALKDYLHMTLPESPKRLQVQSQSVTFNRTERIVRTEPGSTPAITARPVGEAYQPEEFTDVDSTEEEDTDGDTQSPARQGA